MNAVSMEDHSQLYGLGQQLRWYTLGAYICLSEIKYNVLIFAIFMKIIMYEVWMGDHSQLYGIGKQLSSTPSDRHLASKESYTDLFKIALVGQSGVS